MTTGVIAANNAQSTLASALSNVGTTASLASGSGALFAQPTTGQWYVATLHDAATGLLTEIIWCTSMTGDVATVARAKEGTTALNWSAGDLYLNLFTAGTMSTFLQQSQGELIITDTGTANAYAGSLSPPITSLAQIKYATLLLIPQNSNTSGTCTLNLNGLGNETIVGLDGNGILLGAIRVGLPIPIYWDGTYFRVPTTISLQSGQPGNGGLITSMGQNGFASCAFGAITDGSISFGSGAAGAAYRLFSSNSNNANVAELLQGVASKANLSLTYGGGGSSSQEYVVGNYSATPVWTITGTPSGGTFNSVSDARLKDLVGDADPALARKILKAVKLSGFSFKADAEKTMHMGLIAQTAYENLKAIGIDAEKLNLIRPGTPDGQNAMVDLRHKPIVQTADGKRITLDLEKNPDALKAPGITHVKNDAGHFLFEQEQQAIIPGHPQFRHWSVNYAQFGVYASVVAMAQDDEIATLQKQVASLAATVAKMAKP